MRGKIHWCISGFTPECGTKPKDIRIAMGSDTITCGNCRRIYDSMVMVWNESGTRLVSQKKYPEGEVCPDPHKANWSAAG